MIHCASHESMHFPYPGLLTKVFEYFKVIDATDDVDNLTETFDINTITRNHLSVNELNQLVFDNDHSVSDTFLPHSPTAPSSFGNTQLNAFLDGLSAQVGANTKAIDSFQTKLVSVESSLASMSKSMESLHSKLDILKANDQSISRRMDFEFGSLQEGMTHTAKAWEKEFVKLFFKLGSETQFLSKQLISIYGKHVTPWHKKKDWIGDCTLEEITAPLPLPAIPPPAAFGLTKDAYMEKLFQ